MIYNFYDTCSLLEKANVLFDNPKETIVISSITLNELENIKTSSHKDMDIKASARKVLSLLANYDDYIVEPFNEKYVKPFIRQGYKITPDIEILATALNFQKKQKNM